MALITFAWALTIVGYLTLLLDIYLRYQEANGWTQKAVCLIFTMPVALLLCSATWQFTIQILMISTR